MKAINPDRPCPQESVVREKARRYLLLASKPALIAAGPNKVREDTERASREAQLGLAYAMLDLADALRNPGVPVQPGPCMATGPQIFDNLPATCRLSFGHDGAHLGPGRVSWTELDESGKASR